MTTMNEARGAYIKSLKSLTHEELTLAAESFAEGWLKCQGGISSEEREMIRLLDLINAEWTSDPSSVACFDLRIVKDVQNALANFRAMENSK